MPKRNPHLVEFGTSHFVHLDEGHIEQEIKRSHGVAGDLPLDPVANSKLIPRLDW